ncbi:MAG TPA: hypothetical protein VN089_13835 [Duganella sp.]|nr:hypothetical protein [Duganella sp.]
MKQLNVPAKFAFALILTAAAITGCKKQDPVTPEATAPAVTPAPAATPSTSPTPDATTPPAAGTTNPSDATTPPATTTPDTTPPAR